ncbi:unnamed protein product [Pleuronectes platessa]|uniref:Uncharacterized protein n=1 Tax=Pleuronectes platessa TaxID=8262 RepID=A0A9N7U216_PLEPL|nr:unnamed protein product [Pleuronectes platessa]
MTRSRRQEKTPRGTGEEEGRDEGHLLAQRRTHTADKNITTDTLQSSEWLPQREERGGRDWRRDTSRSSAAAAGRTSHRCLLPSRQCAGTMTQTLTRLIQRLVPPTPPRLPAHIKRSVTEMNFSKVQPSGSGRGGEEEEEEGGEQATECLWVLGDKES